MSTKIEAMTIEPREHVDYSSLGLCAGALREAARRSGAKFASEWDFFVAMRNLPHVDWLDLVAEARRVLLETPPNDGEVMH